MRVEHLIAGKPVAGSSYFETVDPATQNVLAEVARGSADDVAAAVAAAKAAFPAWAKLAPHKRAHLLTQAAACVRERLDEVAHLADVVVQVRGADEEQAEPGRDRRLIGDRGHPGRIVERAERADNQVHRRAEPGQGLVGGRWIGLGELAGPLATGTSMEYLGAQGFVYSLTIVLALYVILIMMIRTPGRAWKPGRCRLRALCPAPTMPIRNPPGLIKRSVLSPPRRD